MWLSWGFDNFKSMESCDVSYSQFCCYWPKNIVKPKIEDYGSCKCQTCENVELLLSSLKRNNMVSRDHDLDFFINNSRNGDNEFKNSKKMNLFKTWKI